MIKYSLIVPVYNVEKYVSRCLNSLISQRKNNFDYEIIIVNDGTKDNSRKICEKYANKYENVKLIDQDNRGLGQARNTGIIESCGEYFICIDSDDYVDDDSFLIKLDKICYNSRVDVLCTNFKILDLLSKTIMVNKNINIDVDRYPIEKLIEFDLINISAWTKVVKKDYVISNNIFFNTGLSEDIDWTYRLLMLTNKICCINIDSYVYVKGRKGSITDNSNNMKNLYILRKKIMERCYFYNTLYNVKINNVCKKYLSYIFCSNYNISVKANFFDKSMKVERKYLFIAGGKYRIIYFFSKFIGFKNTWKLVRWIFMLKKVGIKYD